MADELWRLGVTEVAAGIRRGEFSSRDVVEACLARISETNGFVNAVTELRADEALAAADRADAAIAGGVETGSLHGVPVTIKANVDVAGWATVNGSMLLKDNLAAETSPSVQNWLDAGAIVVGRTNCPEFCVRWDTSNDVYGTTTNPWNAALTPGGSSGGAAASLAVGMTPLALGNDLGGSLRHPAQACGIVSVRPSHGRVPNYVPSDPEAAIGLQLANTDGPMTRSVRDARLALQAMAVSDPRDPWWVPAQLDEPGDCELPIAVVVDPLDQGVDEQVASGVQAAADILGDAGFRTIAAEPAALADAVNVWKNIVIGEIFLGLEPAVKEACGPALRRAFEHYRLAVPDWSVEKYLEAFRARRRVLRDWLGFFQRHAAIVAPVSTLPPQASDYDIATPESTATLMHSMRMVVPVNALGLPSAVVPVGVQNGLPQVVQIIGAPFQELRCLRIAEAIEKTAGQLTPV